MKRYETIKATLAQLEYLDELRSSGVTNMYGATPYLERAFGLSHKDAGEILLEWIRTYSERLKKGETVA